MSPVQTGTMTRPAGLHHEVVEPQPLPTIPDRTRRRRRIAAPGGRLGRPAVRVARDTHSHMKT